MRNYETKPIWPPAGGGGRGIDRINIYHYMI